MAKIKFTEAALFYLKKREILDKDLILIADDGGGKYSIKGGTCSIGSHFSLIWVNEPDPDYPEKLDNPNHLRIYTSNYDLVLLQDNLVMDYRRGSLLLKNDSQMLDEGVEIGNGPALLKANHHVVQGRNINCTT